MENELLLAAITIMAAQKKNVSFPAIVPLNVGTCFLMEETKWRAVDNGYMNHVA